MGVVLASVSMHMTCNGSLILIWMFIPADLDGGVHSILPIDERVHARLAALEKALTQNLDHYAGLNPRAFRYKLTRGLFANILVMELCS
jgi:hypothetical protein